MNNFIKGLCYVGWSIVILVWLYVASRMVTRGILRSIKEWKERKKK